MAQCIIGVTYHYRRLEVLHRYVTVASLANFYYLALLIMQRTHDWWVIDCRDFHGEDLIEYSCHPFIVRHATPSA
jgi:hypothetical protein